MARKSCGSGNQQRFGAEMSIHFPGLEGLKKPIVWVFPKLVVCLDCAFAECNVPEPELRVLSQGVQSESAC
jgi:hypothetical protein